jgi:hypothetical protein
MLETFAVETTIPGTECEEFMFYEEAVSYVDELVDAWEEETGEEADRGWASRDNYYAAKCGNYCVAVVQGDE